MPFGRHKRGILARNLPREIQSTTSITRAVEVELQQGTISRLRLASPLLGLLFLVYAYYIGVQLGLVSLLFFVTVKSAAFYILVTMAVFTDKLRPQWANRTGFAVCVILLLNRVFQHYTLPIPVDNASVMAVPIVGGLILQSVRWLALLLVTSHASWVLIASSSLSANFFAAWPVLFGATLVALSVQGARLVNTRRLARLKMVEGERHLLAEDKKRHELAVEGANDGLWYWDLINDQLFLSPRWKSMLGYRDEEIGTEPNEWLDRLHPYYAPSFRVDLAAHLRGETEQFESKYRIRLKNGQYRWMLVRAVAVRDSDGTPTAIAGSQTDISNLIEVESRLIHEATHDQLTGLPNRKHLMKKLHAAHTGSRLYAVLFLDLDRFKIINDSLGHSIGDQLLVATAKRLAFCIRRSDLVARFGGDEFVILQAGLESRGETEQLAARIQRTLREPFQLEGHRVTITPSIGIAFREEGTKPEDLLRNADIAMYDAKDERGSISIFHPDMCSRILKSWEFQKGIREALDRQELFLHYQPQFLVGNRNVVAVEALLRWQRANGELCPPDELIPQAEEMGLIGEIGEWVLGAACAQHNLWTPTGRVPFRTAVNVSALQLREKSFPKIVHHIVSHAGLQPSCLEIEITESALVGGDDVAFHNLCALADSGVRVSIDDFGTGYSCLEYLKRLPLNTLKLSQSLISGIQNDSKSAALLEGLILTAHRLNLEVIAEGVETAEQLSVLGSLGCDIVQGFLLSPPLGPTDLTKIFRLGNSESHKQPVLS